MKTLRNERGQALIEYTLLLALLVLGVVAAMMATGSAFEATWGQLNDVVAQGNNSAPAGAKPGNVGKILDDFLKRTDAFYAERGRWPRSWGDYRFSDIGLDPSDWSGPVEGIYWNPNGQRIGLANAIGDTLEVYVNDLNGNTLHLYNGWNIWCYSGACYYHIAAAGNEVDINTLRVVDTSMTK